MKNILLTIFASVLLLSCTEDKSVAQRDANITRFANTISISATPTGDARNVGGYFLDQGSWAGYTIPQMDAPVAGFCGPYDINSQRWISRMIVGVKDIASSKVSLDTTIYYPGSTYLQGKVGDIGFEQNMYFANKNSAILKLNMSQENGWEIYGGKYQKGATSKVSNNQYIITTPNGDIVSVRFSSGISLTINEDGGYVAVPTIANTVVYAVISYWNNEKEYTNATSVASVDSIIANPEESIAESISRWSEYITKTVREDMPEKYSRVAVKAVMTLISNWKSAKGDLYHEGIIPSHAVRYFNGFWAWDSWKHAAAIAYIEPELAKNQVRTMFDYQQEDGMIIDCIFSNSDNNNLRDTKSSIVGWAVKEIFANSQDTAFVKEMMPKMVKYYKWWYEKRDINKNNLCEFGSTDGSLIGAKWESGMDNAVRFDNSKMLKIYDDAYVMNQESVDLNSFQVFERENLLELAKIAGIELELEDHTDMVRDYFYDTERGFFYDKNMKGEFFTGEACEGWLPLWTKLATKEQAEAVKNMISKPNKFSTYIPFPTCAKDVEGFDPEGYWRGAVWLDQAYFGIRGLRNYGYTKEADLYTTQIFDRCKGLLGDGPITENYNPLEGTRAEARHFSWSAAHILMMYKDYGKNL